MSPTTDNVYNICCICVVLLQLTLLFVYLMVQKFTVGFNFLDNPHEHFKITKVVEEPEAPDCASGKLVDSFSGYGSMDVLVIEQSCEDSMHDPRLESKQLAAVHDVTSCTSDSQTDDHDKLATTL